MRFDLSHRFDNVRLADVEALYMLDDEFNREVFAQLGFDRSVLRMDRDGDRLVRVLRVVSHGGVPAPFSTFAKTFFFDETTEYDFARHRGTWKTVPSVLRERFRSEGTFCFLEERGGVIFRLAGETSANLPLVGRQAENHAISTAQRSHEALAKAVRSRLAPSSRRGEVARHT